MGTEIYRANQPYMETPPPQTPPPSPNQGGVTPGAEPTDPSQNQAQADQAQQAQQAQQDQAAMEAQRLAQQQLFKVPEKPQSLTFEFLSAFQSIFQEGYENYKVPQASQGAEAFFEQRGKEMQKDLGVIREFLREAKRLVAEQKMDIAQMFNWIRTEQGGKFWQRVQQALMREWPGMTQKEGEGGGGKAGAISGVKGKEGEGDALEAIRHQPGRAMLELLKAESNPRSQMESYLLVLQMLKQDDLKDSSQKLLSYLRRRGDLSEEEMRRLMAQYGTVSYYQGPMPWEEKAPVNLWYFFGAALSVPAAMLLGVDFLWSALIGVALIVLVLAFFRFSGK